MPRLPERIKDLLRENPGLSDREITDQLVGRDRQQQHVNATCRRLAKKGHINRITRDDGRIGNYLSDQTVAREAVKPKLPIVRAEYPKSEKAVKTILKNWLESEGWRTSVASDKGHGIDVEAIRDNERWIIEAKGPGSLNPMRVNYFLAVLGQLLQRMDDPHAKYSLAAPDHPQFRGLWDRLPHLAKSRTKISALFVSSNGRVEEVF